MSIADNIRKAALQKSTEGNPTGDQTSSTLQQIGTQATGKGQSTAEAGAVSNVQERLAVGQANAQEAAQQKQALGLATEVANQETETATQQQQIEQGRRLAEMKLEAEEADAVDSMLSQIQYSEAELEDRTDQLEVETAVQKMRLANKEYMHDLDLASKRERLDNKAAFKRKAMQINMDNKLQDVHQQITSNRELSSMQIQAALEERLSNLDAALDLIESKYRNASASQNSSILGDVGSKAISAIPAGGSSAGTDLAKVDANNTAATADTGLDMNQGGTLS